MTHGGTISCITWSHPVCVNSGFLEAGPRWARLFCYQEVSVEKDKAPDNVTKSPPPPKLEPPIKGTEPTFVRGRIEPTEKK